MTLLGDLWAGEDVHVRGLKWLFSDPKRKIHHRSIQSMASLSATKLRLGCSEHVIVDEDRCSK
jgi:hypothetical protein